MRNISNEATVQVPPKEGVDVEQEITKVALFLAKEPGIAGVRPFTLEQSSALLEPWLGNSEALKLLPIPRLIALELDRQSPPDLQALGQSLAAEFPAVTLDDHRHWRVQIQTVTRSLALGGVAILILVGAATTAIIIAATRAAMAANREIVEVLHFVGATDKFIAREFERHFLSLGIRAGLVGAALAIAVFVLLPGIMLLLGGGGGTLSETDRLIGTGSIDIPGYVLLGIVVVVIAALCMLTSRYGVFRILHART